MKPDVPSFFRCSLRVLTQPPHQGRGHFACFSSPGEAGPQCLVQLVPESGVLGGKVTLPAGKGRLVFVLTQKENPADFLFKISVSTLPGLRN